MFRITIVFLWIYLLMGSGFSVQPQISLKDLMISAERNFKQIHTGYPGISGLSFFSGQATILTTPDTLSFDSTYVSAFSLDTLNVANTGTDTLRVTDITSTNAAFLPDMTSFAVNPGSSVDVTVTFSPTNFGAETGWIIIESNDPNTPLDSTWAQGFAIFGPQIMVNPSAISDTIPILDSLDVTIQIINIAPQGAANLDWSAQLSFTNRTMHTIKLQPSNTLHITDGTDFSPNLLQNSLELTYVFAPFDIQFAWPLSTGNAGVEFDETYFYVARWASNLIRQYDMAGTLIEEFSIPGVSGLRDLAFDGTFMYGGAAANTIYQMDFTTKTLVGAISSPQPVRNIAYDPQFDAFWVGNWDTPIVLVDRSGTQLASISNTLIAKYGSAYDDWTPGGPYLWVFNQDAPAGGSPQYIHQFDLNTLTATGFVHDVFPDFPSGPTAVAGGLFTSEGIVPGTASIGGILQGVPDYLFVYELAKPTPPWIKFIGSTSGSVEPGDVQNLNIRFYGLNLDTTYFANIEITSNDPAKPVVTIPVQLKAFIIVNDINTTEQIPLTYAISHNYPNPFNPTTTIKYQLPQMSDVKLVIYNVLGQKMRTLINKQVEAGHHSVVWDGRNDSGRQVATGVYVYRFQAADYARTMKMLMLR